MNKTIKEIWIQALESGEYEQGKGLLREDEDRYCCLGVLCDLYSKIHPSTQWQLGDNGTWYFLDEEATLPKKVMKWAGLESSAGEYDLESSKKHPWLTEDNDNGKSFKEIAEIIREKF